MADAFIYMYVVGAGTASGVATVMFIGWKVYNRSKNKQAQPVAEKVKRLRGV